MTSHNVTGRYSSKVTGNAESVFISRCRHERFQGRDEIMGLLCISSPACYQIRASLTAPLSIDSIPEALTSSSIYDTRCFMYRIYQVVELHHLPTLDLLKFYTILQSLSVDAQYPHTEQCKPTQSLSTHWGRDKMDAISQTTFSSFPLFGNLVWNDIGFVSLT